MSNTLNQIRLRLGLSYRQMAAALGAPDERARPFRVADSRVAPVLAYRAEELSRYYDEWRAETLRCAPLLCTGDGALALGDLTALLGARQRRTVYDLWRDGFLPSRGVLHENAAHTDRRYIAQSNPLRFTPSDIAALFDRAEAYLPSMYSVYPYGGNGTRHRPVRGPLSFLFLRWAQRKHPVFFKASAPVSTRQRLADGRRAAG